MSFTRERPVFWDRAGFLAVILVAAASAGGVGAMQADRLLPPAPYDRLSIGILVLHDNRIGELSEQEATRLARLCKGSPPGCFSRNLQQVRHRVAVMHSSPEAVSPPVAYIYAVLRVHRGRWYNDPKEEEFETVVVGFDLERVSRPGEFEVWLPSIGDWFYGIHVEGVGVSNGWIRLIGPQLPATAWLPPETASLSVMVKPLTGEIVSLSALRAAWPNGRRRVIPPGPYLITRVTRGLIEFRAEVPSDFACGDDDVVPPRVMPPVLRAAPNEFFNPDGSTRFSVVYTKGC